MEIIKRKISLDNFISRDPKNWGEMTAVSFKINLFITQDSDDMGIMTDLDFVPKSNTPPNYKILRDKLVAMGAFFEFMNGGTFETNENDVSLNTRHPDKEHSDYFTKGGIISGLTEDRLDVVKSYDRNFTYKPLFDVEKGVYLDYEGNIIDGVTRVNENNDLNPITYSEDVDIDDPNIGTIKQGTGIFFRTYEDRVRQVNTPNFGLTFIPTTQMYYQSQGFNETNTLLEAETKEEYLFGITMPPEVQNDVFIDRGRVTILQSHLQLGEITNLGDLVNYGNGFYKIIK